MAGGGRQSPPSCERDRSTERGWNDGGGGSKDGDGGLGKLGGGKVGNLGGGKVCGKIGSAVPGRGDARSIGFGGAQVEVGNKVDGSVCGSVDLDRVADGSMGSNSGGSSSDLAFKYVRSPFKSKDLALMVVKFEDPCLLAVHNL